MTSRPSKPAEYLSLARQLAAGEPAGVRLAVVATFTAELLRPYLVVESHQNGCAVLPWFGPFGQLEQLVLDQQSPLWKHQPEVLWIALRLCDVDRYLELEAPELGPDATRARLDQIRRRLVDLARAARERSSASILVSNLVSESVVPGATFDASQPQGLVHLLAEANRQLATELSEIADAHVFDYAGVVAASGGDRWGDLKLWHMARAACSAENMIVLSRRLARSVRALVRPAAKCIVVDLDNTLWGGVIGDDGPEGIQLGDDYPGSVYKDIQAALLGLRRRGFLLAIASKNDEATVCDVLAKHPEMILRAEHFAAMRINWQPKPTALREIAAELKIGVDSLVFVDDNPVERATVRAELPEVCVVELPSEPLGYLAALAEVCQFDRPRLVAEDHHRAAMYASEAGRRNEQQQATSVGEFLQRLEMEAEVGQLDGRTLDRVHQLIHKTNQFNLTTRRHKLEDLRRLGESPDAVVAWLRLRDRFGDSGLVCVGIVDKVDAETWQVDTLLMSCRVMGRGVEDAFLSYLAELARRRGATRLRGIFSPTAKNGIVSDFYPLRGFAAAAGLGHDIYEADLNQTRLEWPETIQRHDTTPKEDAHV